MPTINLLFFFILLLSPSSIPNSLSLCNSCQQYINNNPLLRKPIDNNLEFQQKNKRYWEFNDQTKTWVEVQLPYDLISCINGDCRVVGSIQQSRTNASDGDDDDDKTNGQDDAAAGRSSSYTTVLPIRRRVSLTRMSEASVWVTGPSGSIYERFWNGLQWVIAPHELPMSAGYAVSAFMVNQTILALSESGLLYRMEVAEESQPIWIELDKEGKVRISSGVLSNDKQRLYFCTKNGTLLELLGTDPPRWANHGRPPGASLVAIADGTMFKSGLVFTISGAGNLYEYDRSTKPPWKKHIHQQGYRESASLAQHKACSLHGVFGAHTASLFLLTRGGELIERRLHQRKWKWIVHGNPKGHPLTSITCISRDEANDEIYAAALFATSTSGLVFEYRTQKFQGNSHGAIKDPWLNHEHPPQAQVASGIPGLQLQPGRLIFALDDGRLGELHLSGHGGETTGPNTALVSTRRKSLLKYAWSVLDTPQTEGWNAEYCTEQRGPSNCIAGTKEETLTSKWRKDSKRTQQSYLLPVAPNHIDKQHSTILDDRVDKLFRLRLMQERSSFFMVTKNGLTFEYLSGENAWLWLRHEHLTRMVGVVASYNGSLFTVDEYGSLLVRERSGADLIWTNCTAIRKGRPVVSGPPWDSILGQGVRAKPEDSIFLVSQNGKLLQFTVALRKFKWRDCRNPPGVKIASIVDQERFRENVVFVVGKNGRLYQYNKVTELWHEHYQSQHLVLSGSPGSVMRPSMESLGGSIFMISKDGGLVEYAWSLMDGWEWIEHGTPCTNVTLVGAPGPCFGGKEVLLTSSDGNVYLRFLDEEEWKWRNYEFPYDVGKKGSKENWIEKEYEDSFENSQENLWDTGENCDPKVSSTRPMPFSEDTVIFELQDGRLADMRRMEDETWVWTRTIGTPTSQCTANFWTSWAS